MEKRFNLQLTGKFAKLYSNVWKEPKELLPNIRMISKGTYIFM